MPTAIPWAVRCESCGAEIFFAVNTTAHKRVPIDAHPVADGNVIVHGNPQSVGARLALTADVVGPLEAQAHDGDLYVLHFATCPDADGWQGHTRARRREPEREHA